MIVQVKLSESLVAPKMTLIFCALFKGIETESICY